MSAAKGRYDAVVIGAGPAGALAARGLAQRGHSVLLIDKQRFPRPKVCGCCLNRNALSALEQQGLGGLVQSLGARPLDRLEMIAAGHRAEVALPRGVSMSRGALDTALVAAAREAGAEFVDGVSAKTSCRGNLAAEGHRVVLGNGHTITARVVVVADGLGGSSLKAVRGFETRVRPASRVGFGGVTREPCASDTVSEGTIVMACGRHGYLGAVRLEDGRIDLAAAIDAPAVKQAGGIAGAAVQLVREAGIHLDALPLEQVVRWRSTPALTRRREKIVGPGVFIVGDAAGYVEPFTGEGMAWAITGGSAVAPIASQAVAEWKPEQMHAWQSIFQQRVRRRQIGCRLVSATLRRPRLTRGVVRLLAAAPALAKPLVGRITAPNFARETAPVVSENLVAPAHAVLQPGSSGRTA